MENFNNDIALLEKLKELVIDHYSAADLVDALDLTTEEILEAFGTEFRDRKSMFLPLLGS